MYIAREETMTIEQAQKKVESLKKEAQLYLDLSAAGLIEHVRFISGTDVFLLGDTPQEVRRSFRKFFGVTEKLEVYYMNMDGSKLAVTYNYGKWNVIFYFSNAEEMLRKVSKGKCKIVEQETQKTEKTIMCEVTK